MNREEIDYPNKGWCFDENRGRETLKVPCTVDVFLPSSFFRHHGRINVSESLTGRKLKVKVGDDLELRSKQFTLIIVT